MPDVEDSPRGNLLDGGQNELVEIISELESCIEKSERLGLTLLSARLDYALQEAKGHV